MCVPGFRWPDVVHSVFAPFYCSFYLQLQGKLSLSDQEFVKWKLALVSFGRVEYLEDEQEVVKARFRKHDNYGNWDDYLGLEHQQVS